MTLIAAFEHDSVPFLLGDFLIDSKNTVGTYLRKKVHRLGPNLAIGWADSKLSARMVLRDLNDQFHGGHVTLSALEDFLTTYPVSDLGSLGVYLAGWIIDEKPYCFLWNSLYPNELFFHSRYLIGDGDSLFEELLKDKFIFAGSFGSSNIERAIGFSLTKYCRLLSYEVFQGPTRKLQFGFGFEALFFDQKQFRFIDNILYVPLDVFYDVNTSVIRSVFHGAMLKYRSYDDFSVLQANFPIENMTQVFAITSVFDDTTDAFDRIPQVDRSANGALSVASDYYCLYYRLFASDGLSTTGVAVYRSGGQSNVVTISHPKGGGEHLEFDLSFIHSVYPKVRSATITPK